MLKMRQNAFDEDFQVVYIFATRKSEHLICEKSRVLKNLMGAAYIQVHSIDQYLQSTEVKQIL